MSEGSLPVPRSVLKALERDAYLFRELMDPHELPEASRAEALRWTARGAVEDWLEARR
jgi:hypothetical protein